jgi:hypothetical protein
MISNTIDSAFLTQIRTSSLLQDKANRQLQTVRTAHKFKIEVKQSSGNAFDGHALTSNYLHCCVSGWPQEETVSVKLSHQYAPNRRRLLHNGISLIAVFALWIIGVAGEAHAQQSQASGGKPNILVIFGDDIGQSNVSAYSMGLMGYRTPNIDSIAKNGMIFTDYYAEQSCTAGRSTFITGQATLRTGLSKVGVPAAPVGLQARDITIAQALKPLGYTTGQFGKNHLGDKNEYLPTVHGFDEFFGNLYHRRASAPRPSPSTRRWTR